jgi:hypothetical protein
VKLEAAGLWERLGLVERWTSTREEKRKEAVVQANMLRKIKNKIKFN